jgi:diguanylate cyclase (GGDEF)-like protein
VSLRRQRLWWVWLAVGSSATAGYFLLPTGGLVANVTYNVIGLASALLILAGVRLHRPQRPGMWYWFAAGQITWVVGDVIYEVYLYVLHQQPYPSLADAFYLSAYPMLAVGFMLLVRGRGRRRDVTGLLDASIVATGLGLVFWLFVLRPIAADAASSSLERMISTAYPAADALLLAMLARLVTRAGRRTASVRLLGAAALLMLVADVGFSLITLYTPSYDSGFLDAGWLLSYVTWACAALHPSMRTLGADPDAAQPARMSRGRLVLLAGSSMLAPAMLFVPGEPSDAASKAAIGVGAVALFLLVVLRMSGFVAQVQRQSDQLEGLAMHDDLTGLANRRRFEQQLQSAVSAARHPTVALLDLDGFKGVNDELGHPVGDRLLIGVARRLAEAAGDTALVARMGGDEYAILVPETAAAATPDVIGRLVAALREPIRAGEHELLVGASIGLAGGVDLDPVEILRRADVAMYAAKQDGEPYRWYSADLDQQTSEAARIGAELRTALDAGQFRLVYQPIVELPVGRVVAVETLVRWDHPERGLLAPADFIPVAERTGLIVELGAWILRNACLQAAQWCADLSADAPEKVSVNVSARQLASPGFAQLVAAALDDSGLPAGRLAIEITETAVFEGGRALDALHEVHALGVRIALDDFGTGHSSLTLLQTVPVDILKVDKSFVDNITMAGRHAVIAEALIRVSNGLGLTAVAEGVETAEQAGELYRLGYQLAQGYHFGKPTAEPGFGTPTAAEIHLPRA